MPGKEGMYVLARTFYWIAGTGATVTFGIMLAVLAMAETQGNHSSAITALQAMKHPVARVEHQVDHDMLLALSRDMVHVLATLEEIKKDLRKK